MSNIFVLEGKKQAKDRHTQADHGSECRLGHETVPARSLVEVSQPLSPSPHLGGKRQQDLSRKLA